MHFLHPWKSHAQKPRSDSTPRKLTLDRTLTKKVLLLMHLHLNHNWTGSNSRRSPNFSGLFRRPFSVRAPHSGFKWLKSATKQLQICFPFLSNLCIFKVWTFWETHKIWKNLPYGFDKSADLLSKCQNHKADFFKLCVLFKKSEL